MCALFKFIFISLEVCTVAVITIISIEHERNVFASIYMLEIGILSNCS